MDGERPDRPREPGLTDSVWDMTRTCWRHDPSHRPAMTQVVGILREWPVHPPLWNHYHDLLILPTAIGNMLRTCIYSA